VYIFALLINKVKKLICRRLPSIKDGVDKLTHNAAVQEQTGIQDCILQILGLLEMTIWFLSV
jgi:hypothetical protein